MNNNHPIFEYDRWVCALQDECHIVVRERIMALIKNIKTNLWLIVQYTSNGEIAFPSGGIELWDDKIKTLKKELFEEAWITDIKNIEELNQLFFEVRFYSPHRKNNYYNKTHVFYWETIESGDIIDDEEKWIQNPYRWTIDEIKNKLELWKINTNYESMEYLVWKIKDMNL